MSPLTKEIARRLKYPGERRAGHGNNSPRPEIKRPGNVSLDTCARIDARAVRARPVETERCPPHPVPSELSKRWREQIPEQCCDDVVDTPTPIPTDPP